MTKAEWSGWMQAVFSVVAIFGAIGIAWWQRRDERKREAEINRVIGETVAQSVVFEIIRMLKAIEQVKPAFMLGKDSASDVDIRPLSQLMADSFVPMEDRLVALARVWPLASEQLNIYRVNLRELTDLLKGVGNHVGPVRISDQQARHVMPKLDYMQRSLTLALTELTQIYKPAFSA